MTSFLNLKNKKILITGAARGIGLETARSLHQKGAQVALVGLEPEALKSICQELGSGATYFEADVSDPKKMQKAVDFCANEMKGIDAVIANAGIYHISSLFDAPANAVEHTLNVNLFGVWHTMRASLPYLKANRGYFLTISSMAAITHGPLMGAYAASKAGVEALSDSLRFEVKQDGIDVGVAYFGAIDTDLVSGGKQNKALSLVESVSPKFIREPVPTSKAVAAIEKGIIQRSSRICTPSWINIALLTRGLLQPLMEKKFLNDRRIWRSVEVSREVNQTKVSQLGVAETAKQ